MAEAVARLRAVALGDREEPARESAARSNAEGGRRGWGGVRLRCRAGVGLKGAAARTKHDDASTTAKER
jgi:hypothetical protein